MTRRQPNVVNLHKSSFTDIQKANRLRIEHCYSNARHGGYDDNVTRKSVDDISCINDESNILCRSDYRLGVALNASLPDEINEKLNISCLKSNRLYIGLLCTKITDRSALINH